MTQPGPSNPDPCNGITPPPPSAELDAIYAAQEAISAEVFVAGVQEFQYCHEGAWVLDTSPVVIEDATSGPTTGETLDEEYLQLFTFLKIDVDMEESLEGDDLQWAIDENYDVSLIGGIVSSTMGSTGFFGLYQAIDDGQDRVHVLIPFEQTTAFDPLYEAWFGGGTAHVGPLGDCIQAAYIQYQACLDIAKNSLDGCMDNLWPMMLTGGAIGCLRGAGKGGYLGILGMLIGCGLGALAFGLAAISVCLNNYNAAVGNCAIQLQADIDQCHLLHG